MKEERLLKLIQKKKGFFEAILDLTQHEQHLSFGELLPHLEQKRVLLSCVEEIDQQLEGLEGSLAMLSQEITEELDELKKIIQHILHLDAKNQEKRRTQIKL